MVLAEREGLVALLAIPVLLEIPATLVLTVLAVPVVQVVLLEILVLLEIPATLVLTVLLDPAELLVWLEMLEQ
jgi:hypothetical protein